MVDLLIAGPEGKIEAKYSHNENDKSPIAIILHPDPVRGGSMNTKMVFRLYKIFVNNGFSTIRFNFRGVGKSEGLFDDGEGELSDAASVLDWLQNYNTNSKIVWVAGFSFGAWVAMQLLMRRPEINRFVAISPQPNVYDFSFLTPCPTSGIIISGKKDELVPFESINELNKRLSAQKGIKVEFDVISDANHFFSKADEKLIKSLNKYIEKETALY